MERVYLSVLFATVCALAACGGGGGGSSPPPAPIPAPVPAPVPVPAQFQVVASVSRTPTGAIDVAPFVPGSNEVGVYTFRVTQAPRPIRSLQWRSINGIFGLYVDDLSTLKFRMNGTDVRMLGLPYGVSLSGDTITVTFQGDLVPSSAATYALSMDLGSNVNAPPLQLALVAYEEVGTGAHVMSAVPGSVIKITEIAGFRQPFVTDVSPAIQSATPGSTVVYSFRFTCPFDNVNNCKLPPVIPLELQGAVNPRLQFGPSQLVFSQLASAPNRYELRSQLEISRGASAVITVLATATAGTVTALIADLPINIGGNAPVVVNPILPPCGTNAVIQRGCKG